MANKGLEITFVHYGIRREDMSLIEALCAEYKLDVDWVKDELLKEFHDKKIKNNELDQKAIEKIIDKALQRFV
jgi:hypothetical protein